MKLILLDQNECCSTDRLQMLFSFSTVVPILRELHSRPIFAIKLYCIIAWNRLYMKQVGGQGIVRRSGALRIWVLEDLTHLLINSHACIYFNSSAQVYLLLCLQQNTSSVRLLRRDSGSAKAMMVFSEMHRSHLCDPH